MSSIRSMNKSWKAFLLHGRQIPFDGQHINRFRMQQQWREVFISVWWPCRIKRSVGSANSTSLSIQFDNRAQSKPGQPHFDRFTKPSIKLGISLTKWTGCLTLNPNSCTQRSTQSERGLIIGGGRSSSKLPEGTVTWGPTLRFLREPWLSAYPFCEQFLRLKANFAAS